MTRKGESVQLSLTREEKQKLAVIAAKFGCTRGERPNISALLKSIATGSLIVYWGDDTPSVQIRQQQAREAVEKIKQGLDELLTSL